MDISSAGTDNLYPALFQCFTVILCGYIAGRTNLVSQTESKGIATFVGTFSLPALIFLSLARLDFSVVNWTFLLAILLGKSVVFFVVIAITLLVSRRSKLGRAGIYAIFCTQSNDFALGYPIISAIYNATHANYAMFLYLMAPISLAMLNPIAFVLMEINKQNAIAESSNAPQNEPKRICKWKMLKQIAKGIAFNPILVMTILGIIGNLIFKHQIPIYIEGLLQVLGNAFTAASLFQLGLRMVGQIQRLRGPALLVPTVLIMAKLVILPVVLKECVSLLKAGANETDTESLATYAFLYGTIPTAPAVFVFSNIYQLEIDLVASSMVICTILSAPMMFMSAQLINISKDFAEQLKQFGFDLSIASLAGLLWVAVVLLITKKYKRMPHRLTMCLLMSQILLSISVIAGGPTTKYSPSWRHTLQQSAMVFGMYSCLLWTAMLSVGLFMLESRGPCFVMTVWPVLCFVAWGAPAVMVGVLLATKTEYGEIDDRCANAIRMCLLVFCLTVTSGSLIVYTRHRKRSGQIAALSAAVADHGDEAPILGDTDDSIQTRSLASPNGLSIYGTITATPSPNNGSINRCCSDGRYCGRRTDNEDGGERETDIEDINAEERACACLPSQNYRCNTNEEGNCQYLEELERAAGTLGLLPPEQSRGRGRQMLKHTVLVIACTLAMFISLAYTTWSMMTRDESGIFVEIEFLDVAANFGQGLLLFALFGFDADAFLLPAIKLLYNNWFGHDTVTLPAVDALAFETKHVCDQFITHHLGRCKEAICKDQRWRMRTYKGVFRGSCLVNWLISCGLAKDENEAVQYGRHLLEGRLIAHINNAHHFINSPLLYTFKFGSAKRGNKMALFKFVLRCALLKLS